MLKKFIIPTLVLTVALGLGGCSKPNNVYKGPITANVIERAPNSLQVDVTDFSWAYLPNGRLEITGRAQNNTRRDQYQVTFFAMLFDEAGAPVALGESAVSPVLLPAGGQGSFRIVAQTSRPSGIRHLRLLTKAVPE
ncbi:MAG: FxLYD domain-containing protein [Candidatus Adiutrix sp.]|jgi:hypothetical protein|nr:FxLYD domain-containing protein [Candidatus Adiutrix sp.]